MRIHVRAVNLSLDRRAREEVESRLRAALGRLEHRILRVGVRLVDQNGPRGGEDISCLVEARLRPRGMLFIEETDRDIARAVGRAAEAARTAITRSRERSRDLRRRAPRGPLFGASDGTQDAERSFA
jgi:ribosome-associated translation inhibitor RaiA